MSRGELDDYAIRAIVEKFEIMRAEEVCRGCCMLNLSDEARRKKEKVDLCPRPRRGSTKDVDVKDCLDTKVA
jgi:hypothetical protein